MAELKNIPIKDIEQNKGQIDGLPQNPRYIKDNRYKALKKSIEDAPEMLDYRRLLVIEYNNKFVTIAGNMRLVACKEIGYSEMPCYVLPKDTPAEKLREYAIKDNIGFGNDDWDILANEWDADELIDWGYEMPEDWTGNDEGEMVETEIVEDEIPEDVETRCKRGDVWILGEHRLMCGDSTKAEDVEKLMNGAKADMVFTDPPYGCGFESKGVLNDNQNQRELVEFNKKWIKIAFERLKDNGSFYCWGIDESVMRIYAFILLPMIEDNKITFRNLITWDKGVGSNQNDANMRSYACADEKCLFVMYGVQGFNNNQDNYFEGWEQIRLYLAGEAQRVGLDGNKLREICGVGMFSHWFTKSQWGLITEEHYTKLQQYYKGQAFKREYDEIKREYDEIKREWYETRAYFDNTHDNMNNVWHFDRTSAQERELTGGHATPKPIALCSRAIKSSSRENEIVLDVFGGSGSTMIACEQLNRTCYMCELDEHYCDVIIARWEKLTGKKAEKIN